MMDWIGEQLMPCLNAGGRGGHGMGFDDLLLAPDMIRLVDDQS